MWLPWWNHIVVVVVVVVLCGDLMILTRFSPLSHAEIYVWVISPD